MTKKQDSNGSKPHKYPGETGVEWIDQRRRPARAALEALSGADLAEVLCWELDRRRLDAAGNPMVEAGLYEAVMAGTRRLLGEEQPPADEKMADNVAAVGRGVRVRSKTQDHSPELRQLAEWIDVNWGNEKDPAGALARTLTEKYHPRRVKREDVVRALAARGRGPKIELLALAVGIVTSKEAIKSALRQ